MCVKHGLMSVMLSKRPTRLFLKKGNRNKNRKRMNEIEQWSCSIAKATVNICAIESDAQRRNKVADGQGQGQGSTIKSTRLSKFMHTSISLLSSYWISRICSISVTTGLSSWCSSSWISICSAGSSGCGSIESASAAENNHRSSLMAGQMTQIIELIDLQIGGIDKFGKKQA